MLHQHVLLLVTMLAVSWLIALLIELCAGLTFIFLGLMGEQIRLIAERGRNTPLVVEKARVNF